MFASIVDWTNTATDPTSAVRWYNNGAPADNFALSGSKIFRTTGGVSRHIRVRINLSSGMHLNIRAGHFSAVYLGPTE